MPLPDALVRRAPRREILQRREALKLLSPLLGQIGSWQASAARLHGLAARLREHGGHMPHVVDETLALSRVVDVQNGILAEQLQTLPPLVVADGRVGDVRRALASLDASLRETRALLNVKVNSADPSGL